LPLTIEFKNYEELITFLYREKALLFLVAYKVIQKSVDNHDDVAVVANLLVNDSVYTIKIERDDFNKHLNKSLSYFETIEDYETCQKIKDLIDFL